MGYDTELGFRSAELTGRLAELTPRLAELTGCAAWCGLPDAMMRSSPAPRRAVAPRSAPSTSRGRPIAMTREIGARTRAQPAQPRRSSPSPRIGIDPLRRVASATTTTIAAHAQPIAADKKAIVPA